MKKKKTVSHLISAAPATPSMCLPQETVSALTQSDLYHTGMLTKEQDLQETGEKIQVTRFKVAELIFIQDYIQVNMTFILYVGMRSRSCPCHDQRRATFD